jgi:hypothetical protein
VLDFASAAGTFTLELPALGPGLAWDASKLMVTGELRVTDADFDNNGVVDGWDLLTWQRGAADAQGLAVWQTGFGGGQVGGAGQGAPEPGTALMSLILAASGFSRAWQDARTKR